MAPFGFLPMSPAAPAARMCRCLVVKPRRTPTRQHAFGNDGASACRGHPKRRLPIIIDGGVYRGQDVFRALALGASVVALGRPLLYGSALGGSQGVQSVYEHVRNELVMTVQLVGTIKSIRSFLARRCKLRRPGSLRTRVRHCRLADHLISLNSRLVVSAHKG